MRHGFKHAGLPAPMVGVALVSFVLTLSSAARAEPDATSLLPGGTHLIDFSQFVGRMYNMNGPVDLGQGVTWTAQRNGVIGDMSFGLRTNGLWNSGRRAFVGLDIDQSSMLFTFSREYQWVAALVNYAPFNENDLIPTFEAYDIHWNLIESISQDVRTPNGVNVGGELAIELDSPRIHAVRYSARFGVLDDFMFGEFDRPGRVPGPGSAVLLALPGLIGAASRRRRPQA